MTKKRMNWFLFFVIITPLLIIVLIINGIIIGKKYYAGSDTAQKVSYAAMIGEETDYNVVYNELQDAYIYTPKAGNWSDALSSNLNEYASSNTVQANFINNWRNNVIPSFKRRCRQPEVGGSKLIVLNPLNHNRTVLTVRDGRVLEDVFQDIQ